MNNKINTMLDQLPLLAYMPSCRHLKSNRRVRFITYDLKKCEAVMLATTTLKSNQWFELYPYASMEFWNGRLCCSCMQLQNKAGFELLYRVNIVPMDVNVVIS